MLIELKYNDSEKNFFFLDKVSEEYFQIHLYRIYNRKREIFTEKNW